MTAPVASGGSNVAGWDSHPLESATFSWRTSNSGGLVPSQDSSGGKHRLGRITKRGDDYLRTLLIQGAKSVLITAENKSDKISLWLVKLRERVGWQKAIVAMANKNARILWAVLTRGSDYDPEHVPPKPQAKQPPSKTAPASALIPPALPPPSFSGA